MTVDLSSISESKTSATRRRASEAPSSSGKAPGFLAGTIHAIEPPCSLRGPIEHISVQGTGSVPLPCRLTTSAESFLAARPASLIMRRQSTLTLSMVRQHCVFPTTSPALQSFHILTSDPLLRLECAHPVLVTDRIIMYTHF